jgi:hypothetical protein
VESGQLEIPEKLTLEEGYYFTDGGSTVLIGTAPDGTKHQITLGQHRFLEVFDPNLIPGRLYFDSQMAPVRSEMEGQVIALLRASEIAADEPPKEENGEAGEASGPTVVVGDDLKEYYAKIVEGKRATIQHLRGELLKFVNSREYVKIAKKMKKKTEK